MTTATLPRIRAMTAAEVRGLKNRPASVPSNKETLLQAIRGILTEAEADELERRIHESCERIDEEG